MKIPARVRFIRESVVSAGDCVRYCVQSPSLNKAKIWKNLGTLFLYQASYRWQPEKAFEDVLNKLDAHHGDRFDSTFAHEDPTLYIKVRIDEMGRRLISDTQLRKASVLPSQFETVESSEPPRYLQSIA